MRNLSSFRRGFTPLEISGKFSYVNQKTKKFLTGFTLIEILFYISVLTIVVFTASSFLLWAIRTNNRVKAATEVLNNFRRAMEIMSYEIKEARGVYIPTSTSTQLSLETDHYLPLGEESTYIDFYLCGTATSTLCLKKESQDPIAITSDRVEVKRLNFIQVATTTPSIQINLEIGYKNPGDRPEYRTSINATSTVSLR